MERGRRNVVRWLASGRSSGAVDQAGDGRIVFSAETAALPEPDKSAGLEQ